ncbi:ABC transporter ATP-binding protein/permease [Enterocloster citroniae]|uniref:ABC transporter ATP-binding protein n=1 Tax=Enterocloster citroniae TaxID=358743 RepID=UPI001D0702DD|nr:ABC transporter ATP-binding protein [Enterocloster citroniae]MCB7062808.1 ABC transporter ATP-binding protein/permease [Enterocloster citroniae]
MENNRKSKANESLGILMRVIKYMVTNYKLAFLAVLACIILSAAATARGMLFIQSLVDDYIQPLLAQAAGMQAAGGQGAVGGQAAAAQAALDFTPLFTALCGLAALYLVSILASYAYNRVMVTVSQGTMKRLRIQLFERMESLPIKYFDTHAHGDIMSVYTNDVDTLRQLMSQSVPQVINSAVTLAATAVSMLLLNVPLTLLTFAMACVMLAVTRCLSGRSAVHFGEQQKALGIVDGYIEEMMDGQKVVKVFCHENQAMKEFEDLNERLRDSADKANRYANLLMPVNSNIGNLSYVLCAVAGSLLALNGIGGITIGTIMAFVGLNKNFTQPITQISQQMNSVVMAAAGAERVFELLDEMPEEDQGYVEFVNVKEHADGTLEETDQRTGVWAWKHPHKQEGTVTYKKMEGGVVFDGVDFGYDDSKMVLHDIKMFAEPGQKIAFVGSTGAGKTTITNLINRFYDIQDGKIRYDGININKIKKPALRRSLGIVLQDTHLFTGTVMDNIRYGRLDATDAECMNAAKLANADSFIRRLPDGYETVLTGDGGSLSQGQRQLLAIARAAVADPPVLILDEATSSIDTRTESLVQAGMDALMKGRTTFVIAHRLSTIRNSDCIMVMEQGRIIERGSHDELIHRKGKYYQLYTGNFEEAG